MKIQTFYFLFSFILGSFLGAERIESAAYQGWGESLRIENEAMEVVVVPETGRMVHLSRKGAENLLTFREELAGQLPPAEEGDWVNYGGDWMWPAHQDHWGKMGGRSWPPLRILERPWRGEARRLEEGGAEIVLRRDYGAPLFLQAERRIHLPPGDAAELRVEQTLRRVYASEVPVLLWQITQMAGAEQVLLSRAPDSRFDLGYRVVNFEAPPESLLDLREEALVYQAGVSGEHKLGTDGHWVAGRRGKDLLMQWAEGGQAGGTFPDGGCSVVLYSHAGLGYSEIETQSVFLDLAPGEAHRNTVVYRLLELPEGAGTEEILALIQEEVPARDVVGFYPGAPTPESVIQVRVRTDEAGGILHWGVNGPDGGWQLPAEVYRPAGSVVAPSGVAVETPLPDPVDGVAVLELGPFSHPGQIVDSLHAVVRWGNRWESRDGANYNLELETHPDAAEVRLEVQAEGSTLGVSVQSSPAAEEIRLFAGGREVAEGKGAELRQSIDMSDWAYGPHEIRARALREGRLSTAASVVWKLPELPEPVPGDFQEWGTKFLEEAGSWQIQLFAPNARFVELEWLAGGELRRKLMRPGEGGMWLASVDGVFPLQYRYVLDGHRRFADPWSKDVLWLTPEGAHSHLPEHAWTLAGTLPEAMGPWNRPPMETWVIYELSIPDVAPPGSYKGLEEQLDYIAGLGVNAIEPLPVTTFPGDESWGYNPVFHMGLERSYGTPADFADLIRAARERGIAYVFDIVLNHIEANSPLHRMHGSAEVNPYFVDFGGFNWGFPKLDQQNSHFKRYVRDALEHWVKQWGVDGYRYDATQWIQWSGYNDWGVSWMSYVVRQADPGVVQIAENLPSEPDMVKGTELDSEWDGHYRWRMRRVFTEGNWIGEPEKMREILDPRNHAYQNGWQRMQYIESHDEERFVRELREAGYSGEEVFRRHLAAAAVTLTVPGIPMLYAGQEWGEETKKVVGLNPLNWDLREEPARARMVEQFRELIELRTSERALHHDRIDILHLDAEGGTLAYVRPGVPDSILVVINVSPTASKYTIPEEFSVVKEYLADGDSTLEPDLELLPGQARVFRVILR